MAFSIQTEVYLRILTVLYCRYTIHGPGDLLGVIDINCLKTVIASFFCKRVMTRPIAG